MAAERFFIGLLCVSTTSADQENEIYVDIGVSADEMLGKFTRQTRQKWPNGKIVSEGVYDITDAVMTFARRVGA